MKILALEFATDQRSVAVLDGTTVRGTALTAATRHTPAVGLITQALAAAGWEREAIDLVAVGLGPGSYTGLRTAIALAQGWQLAGGDHGVRLWGGSSVESLAREAWLQGVRGPLSVVVDAQRQEFYLAGYVLDSAGPQAVAPLRVATLAETQARAAAGDLLAGPDITRWFPAGLPLYPAAATLGLIAAGREDFVPGEQLEPIYLRATTFVKAPPPRLLPPELRAPAAAAPGEGVHL